MNTYIPTSERESRSTTSVTAASTAAATIAGQFLIFYLGRQEYGIHVPRIREIISLVPLQLAPGRPYCVKGVINILGKIIPVIDLRLKLGLTEACPCRRAPKKDPDATWAAGEGPDLEQYPRTGQIVVIKSGENQPRRRSEEPGLPGGRGPGWAFDDRSRDCGFTGIEVDCISEIASFRPEDIEPAAAPEGQSALNCILGLVKVGRSTRTLLDIDLALDLDYAPDYALSRTLSTVR